MAQREGRRREFVDSVAKEKRNEISKINNKE
jgi:hypothetical protein